MPKSWIKTFYGKVRFLESRIKRVMIIGGGGITVYLALELLNNNFDVKIIEANKEKCLELSELLPNATIIYGDGSDQRVLSEEGMESSDAVICLTGNDEENIIISLYANKKKLKK